MKVKISLFDQSGRFYAMTECDSDELQFQPENRVIGLHGADSYFCATTSSVVMKPERPSNLHRFSYATKQWEPDSTLADTQAKLKRNQLLTASDWTQLPDVPLATKAAWATYRQALRDITEQSGYPLEVVWPVAPA